MAKVHPVKINRAQGKLKRLLFSRLICAEFERKKWAINLNTFLDHIIAVAAVVAAA